MHVVPVAMLPVLIVALVVAVAYITTVAITVTVTVVVLVALLVVGRPLFAAYLGAVPLLAVRTMAVVLFAAAFLMRGTGFLVGR